MADGASAPREYNICFTMHGIGVSGGIAIGHAHLFTGMSTEVDHYEVASYDVPREQRRYDRAVKEVKDELAGSPRACGRAAPRSSRPS